MCVVYLVDSGFVLPWDSPWEPNNEFLRTFRQTRQQVRTFRQTRLQVIPREQKQTKNIEILRMTGEAKPQRLKQTNKYLFCYKQLNTFDLPYYKHKCLDSERSTFSLVNRYIIFNKFDKRY